MSDESLDFSNWIWTGPCVIITCMQAETGGKLRHFTHESQQNWPVLSWDSEQSRDWRKKSPLPVTSKGLLLIIERGNMIPKRTVSQLQNSFWEWEEAVKRHYLTTGVTSSSSDLGLLQTRRMVLQKYLSHGLEPVLGLHTETDEKQVFTSWIWGPFVLTDLPYDQTEK